jgi:hypothetical protein
MNKKLNLIILSAFVLIMSSCLKSKEIIGPDANNSAGAIIEFANPTYITSGVTIATPRYNLSLSELNNKLHIDVKYSGTGKAAPSDVTVNIAVDAATLAAHNTQSGLTATNGYVAAPTVAYTAIPASVVIPSGQTKAGFDITVNPALLTAGRNNTIPLKITSASTGTVSGNFGAIVLALVN